MSFVDIHRKENAIIVTNLVNPGRSSTSGVNLWGHTSTSSEVLKPTKEVTWKDSVPLEGGGIGRHPYTPTHSPQSHHGAQELCNSAVQHASNRTDGKTAALLLHQTLISETLASPVWKQATPMTGERGRG